MDEWHKLYKRSWWDGTRTAWCGKTIAAEDVQEGVIGLFGPECQACKTAKRKAKQ